MRKNQCEDCVFGVKLPRHGTCLPIRWCSILRRDVFPVEVCDKCSKDFQDEIVPVRYRDVTLAVLNSEVDGFDARTVTLYADRYLARGATVYDVAADAAILRHYGYDVIITEKRPESPVVSSRDISPNPKGWTIAYVDNQEEIVCDRVVDALVVAFGYRKVIEAWPGDGESECV